MAAVCDQQDDTNEWIMNGERCVIFAGKTVLQDWWERSEETKGKGKANLKVCFTTTLPTPVLVDNFLELSLQTTFSVTRTNSSIE
jgi:hypothetical protein